MIGCGSEDSRAEGGEPTEEDVRSTASDARGVDITIDALVSAEDCGKGTSND